MKGCHVTKKRSILFQSLAVVYLLFCLAYLLTSPTSASFHDVKSIDVTLAAASEFDQTEEQKVDNDLKQTKADNTDQKADNEEGNQEPSSDKGTTNHDNNHLPEESERQSEETLNPASDPETLDQTVETSGGGEEETVVENDPS